MFFHIEFGFIKRPVIQVANHLKARGRDAELEVCGGLPHGFGYGEGTVAEGWLERAVTFWERQTK